MRKSLLILLFIFCFTKSDSQNWQWATSAGGVYSDFGGKICKDLDGNYYVASYATYPTCFFNTDTFSINGFNDFFITKYDETGNEIWIKQFGGANTSINHISEGISDLIYDSTNNCTYATGQYYESCVFGATTLGTMANDLNIYLIKLDLNGNCLWAVQGGSSGEDGGTRLATDNAGNIYMSGGVASVANFDTSTISGGGFLAKYQSTGEKIWLKNISGVNVMGFVPKYQISSLKWKEYLYMYGVNNDSLTLDTIPFSIANYRANILSAWDTSGGILWGKQFGGPFSTIPGEITIDKYGNIYCAGNFTGNACEFRTDTLYSADPNSSYIVKCNKMGVELWIKQLYSSQEINSISISSDIEGNTYLTGGFKGNAIFDTYNVTASSSQDMFIARFNNTGNCLGLRHEENSFGMSIFANSDGSTLVTGDFETNINLDSYSLTSIGDKDMFIVKLDQITGIHDFSFSPRTNQFFIHPNPTKDKCFINIPPDFLNEKNLELSIFNIDGKLIQQQIISASENEIKINLEKTTKGIYTISLKNKSKSYTGKVVIE